MSDLFRGSRPSVFRPLPPAPTKRPTAHADLNERAIYLEYELDRRRRLTGIIAPLIGILGAATFVVFTIFLFIPHGLTPATRAVGLYLADAAIGTAVVVLGLAIYMMRRGHINLAAGLTAISVSAAIVLVQTFWDTTQGIDPFGLILFSVLDVTIVLVGVLGDARTTIGLTVGVTIFTAALWLLAPRAPDMEQIVASEMLLVGPISVFTQWAIAVTQLASLYSSRQTLAELGAVQVAYERARKLDQLKDEFISSVNHELRTPLTAMLSYLEVVKLSAGRVPPEKLGELIEQANHAGADLRLLVNSILQTRRLDQGADRFTPEAVDLHGVLRSAARLIDPREGKIVERDLRVNMPAGLSVWGERVRLQQILTNLLSNALKYSNPGTPVDVSAQVVKEEEQSERRGRRSVTRERWMVEIAVRDYGHGIPPDQIPLLFQRFVRLPRDLASSVIGNGLGLWLCKAFAEAMGGRIWVESMGVPGEGSTFFLRLPVPPAEDAVAAGVPTGEPQHVDV